MLSRPKNVFQQNKSQNQSVSIMISYLLFPCFLKTFYCITLGYYVTVNDQQFLFLTTVQLTFQKRPLVKKVLSKSYQAHGKNTVFTTQPTKTEIVQISCYRALCNFQIKVKTKYAKAEHGKPLKTSTLPVTKAVQCQTEVFRMC